MLTKDMQNELTFRNPETMIYALIRKMKQKPDFRFQIEVTVGNLRYFGVPGEIKDGSGSDKYLSLYDLQNNYLHFVPFHAISCVSVLNPNAIYDVLSGGKFDAKSLDAAPSRLDCERLATGLGKELLAGHEVKLTLKFAQEDVGCRLNFKNLADVLRTTFKSLGSQADFVQEWKKVSEMVFVPSQDHGLSMKLSSGVVTIEVPNQYALTDSAVELENQFLALF